MIGTRVRRQEQQAADGARRRTGIGRRERVAARERDLLASDAEAVRVGPGIMKLQRGGVRRHDQQQGNDDGEARANEGRHRVGNAEPGRPLRV